MLGMAQKCWLAESLIKTRSGEIAPQVVQPISSPFSRGGGREVHQAPPDQLAESILGGCLFHLPYRRRYGQVEVGGEDGEHGPEPLQLRSKKVVAQAEGGFHQLQALPDIFQSFDVISDAQIRLFSQGRSGISQGDGKAAA